MRDVLQLRVMNFDMPDTTKTVKALADGEFTELGAGETIDVYIDETFLRNYYFTENL